MISGNPNGLVNVIIIHLPIVMKRKTTTSYLNITLFFTNGVFVLQMVLCGLNIHHL